MLCYAIFIMVKKSGVIAFLTQPQFRKIMAIGILLITVLVFVHYISIHPNYLGQLAHISPYVIIWVILLNVLMIILLMGIYNTVLALCGRHLANKENLLLTSYSSLANYFGPLQSGPGVRAVYVKTRLHVRMRDFLLASLIAYAFFAFFSGLFLFVGNRPWWQTLLAILAITIFSYITLKWFKNTGYRDKSPTSFALRVPILITLFLLSFLQVVLTAITYYVELKAINSHIQIRQAVSYAGAANFALFVSLTPDAIGIRESFLILSKHLHHISTANIVSANIIDRSAYLLFLGLLFLFVLLIHARSQLKLKSLPQSDS